MAKKNLGEAANHILVGLGGTGGKILREFKKRMFEEFDTEERIKQPIALLYIDSTDEMMSKDGRPHPDFQVLGKDASFTQSEFLNIKEVNVSDILDHVANYPQLHGIVNNAKAIKSAIGNLGEAAGQKRRAGRLLFAVNASDYVNKLKAAKSQCQMISNNTETYIHIMAGLCGGTGSGSIIDVIVQTRKEYPDAIIVVYAMIPEQDLPNPSMDISGRYYPNGYAALRELNALQTGRWSPQDVTGNGPIFIDEKFFKKVKGVANGLTLYSNINENGHFVESLEELPKIVSDYLYARIFLLNEKDEANLDIKRAFTFENMDEYAFENDETVEGKEVIARTRKINSFGIKRVIYPTNRILQHITYTVGESILYKFKYNHWSDNQGYVNTELNTDYRNKYLNSDGLQRWMLDDAHLTLEKKVLETDKDYPSFKDYWHDKAIENAEDAKNADCPLNELDAILGDIFKNQFREEGVEAFYSGKTGVIPEIAKEICHKIEAKLSDDWRHGDISIFGLQKVSKLLLDKIDEIRTDLETKSRKEKEDYEKWDEDRTINVADWSHLGVLQRMIGKGARRYADHQEILAEYYTSKTKLSAWEFAKELAKKLQTELITMNENISNFGQKINDAITETEKLVAAQRKINKGLEDGMTGTIIEVSEDETMAKFEDKLKIDRTDMDKIATIIRKEILSHAGDFIDFGRLTSSISIDKIKNAFDNKLMELIVKEHEAKMEKDKKVIGLNILTQLRQKLKTEADIKEFANKIIRQSGVFLNLDKNQILLQLYNNELSDASWDSKLNQKVRLISMPAPDDDLDLSVFADKLERAFKEVDNKIIVNKKSPRKEELSVVTVSYCFPMRAIEWLKAYKRKYERCLNTGNPTTDLNNAILIHSEGTGEDLPSLFAVDNAKDVLANAKQGKGTQLPPSMPGVVPPIVTPINLFVAIGGEQHGPYNIDQCKQMVADGQLTQQSMVWMEGLSAWTLAGQVPALASLFVSAPLSNIPPIPTSDGSTPPPMK